MRTAPRRREPGQPEQGETRTISVLEFEGETRALLRSFHKNRTGDPRAEFRVDGTQGSIRGTIGLRSDYPRGRADTLELNSRALPTDGWLRSMCRKAERSRAKRSTT